MSQNKKVSARDKLEAAIADMKESINQFDAGLIEDYECLGFIQLRMPKEEILDAAVEESLKMRSDWRKAKEIKDTLLRG